MDVILNDNNKMPSLGFGTWHLAGEKGIEVFKTAIKLGYRCFDTAEAYGNESELGIAINECIRDGLIKREDVFIATKINPHNPIGYNNTIKAFNNSLERLNLDYIDLYMIHWPNLVVDDSWKNLNAETWRAMEDLQKQGKIRSLGISNFMIHHIKTLLNTARILPAINQINFNPTWQQRELIKYCNEKNIQVVAWAPVVRIKDWNKKILNQVAEKYNKSVPQICLRYCLQNNVIPLSCSKNPDHMKENLSVTEFSINQEDMKILDTLNSHPWDHDSQPDCLYEIFRQRELLSQKKHVIKEAFYLFNFFKILQIIRKSENCVLFLLFGIIPLLKFKNINEQKTKCYFFGIIRIGTIRRKVQTTYTPQLPVY